MGLHHVKKRREKLAVDRKAASERLARCRELQALVSHVTASRAWEALRLSALHGDAAAVGGTRRRGRLRRFEDVAAAGIVVTAPAACGVDVVFAGGATTAVVTVSACAVPSHPKTYRASDSRNAQHSTP